MRAEKRTMARSGVVTTAFCRWGNRCVRDFVANVSPLGLFLKTSEPVRVGTAVTLGFQRPGTGSPTFLSARGRVAHLVYDINGLLQGFGVRFDEPLQEL